VLLFSVTAAWLMGISQSLNDQTTPTLVPDPLDRVPPSTLLELSGCMASECHPDKKETPFLHGPMFVNACDACHVLADPETHRYELAREPEQLCVFCHETAFPMDSSFQTIHEPYQSGSCLPCHNPHGGEGPSLLKSENHGDLCMSCHEDFIGTRDVVHSPVWSGACNTCHQPHVSDGPMLLQFDGRDMCLRCHESLETEIASARVVHEPVLNDCQICHDPHASDNVSMLLDKPMGLCVGCHHYIHDTIENSTTAHGSIFTERSCLNCHSPHASDHSWLLKDNIDALCFQCHNTEIELDDGTRIANIKETIESGASLHSPVTDGNCTACHDVHGGKNPRLLVRNYTDELYAPFDLELYALCFGCHDQSLVTNKQSTTVTQFRNGDTNLHFVHVNRAEKGRSCSVCHDSHAGEGDRHLHDTVAFGPGGWSLPIRFERIGDGGSCASGCHERLRYDRSIPVIYPPKINIDNDD